MDYNINPFYTLNHNPTYLLPCFIIFPNISMQPYAHHFLDYQPYAPFFLITMQHVSISPYAPSPWPLSLCHLFPSLHLFQLFLLNHMPPIPLTTVSATISMTTLPWLLCPFFITTVSIHMPLCPLFHILLPMHNLCPRLPSSLFFCFYAISCFILICCLVKGLLVSSLLHNHLLALYYKYHLVFPESLFPISSLGIKKYCLALVISLFWELL